MLNGKRVALLYFIIAGLVGGLFISWAETRAQQADLELYDQISQNPGLLARSIPPRPSTAPASYMPSPLITLASDADIANYVSLIAGGSGAPADPYIFENLSIVGDRDAIEFTMKNYGIGPEDPNIGTNTGFTIGQGFTKSVVIRNCDFQFCTIAIFAEGQTGLAITNNTIADCGNFGILLKSCINCSIAGNSLHGVVYQAICAYRSELIDIAQNEVIGNPDYGSFEGISLRTSIHSAVRSNFCTRLESCGIVLHFFADHNLVIDNLVTKGIRYKGKTFNEHGYGFALYQGCCYNLVTRNNISDNEGGGIAVGRTSEMFPQNNTISYNILHDNGWGPYTFWDLPSLVDPGNLFIENDIDPKYNFSPMVIMNLIYAMVFFIALCLFKMGEKREQIKSLPQKVFSIIIILFMLGQVLSLFFNLLISYRLFWIDFIGYTLSILLPFVMLSLVAVMRDDKIDYKSMVALSIFTTLGYGLELLLALNKHIDGYDLVLMRYCMNNMLLLISGLLASVVFVWIAVKIKKTLKPQAIGMVICIFFLGIFPSSVQSLFPGNYFVSNGIPLGFSSLFAYISLLLLSYIFYSHPEVGLALQFRVSRITVIDTDSGVPIYNYLWDEKGVDPILFSGLLQGITTFCRETLNSGELSEIKLESGILLLHHSPEVHLASVILVKRSTRILRESLTLFTEQFIQKFRPMLNDTTDIEKFKPANEILKRCFPFTT